MEPVENPAASKLTALDSFRKFTCVVADYGHALIACHAVLAEKLIESRCGRLDLFMHIGVQLWRTVGERRSPGHDVHVAARASQLVATSQPRRINAHGGDTAGFADLYICRGLRQLRDVALNISVEQFSKGVNLVPGAAERNALV